MIGLSVAYLDRNITGLSVFARTMAGTHGNSGGNSEFVNLIE